jgi:hypothetical protein
MHFRAGALIVACASVGVLSARGQFDVSGAPQTVDHSALTGVWVLDDAKSKLEAENWRNRQVSWNQPAPCLPTLTRPGEPETYDCQPPKVTSNTYNSIGELGLFAFGRTMLEPPQTLTIRADMSSVSIDGRPRDITTYRVDGQTHKLRVLLSRPSHSAPPPGRHSAPPRSEDVNVRTQWHNESLVLEMSSEFGGTAFAITETLLPADDARQLFVLIDVRKPTLKPAVKPIRRVYVRSK